MRWCPTPLEALVPVLGLAALPACNGKASTELVTLEDVGTESDAGSDASVPPPPAPSSFDTSFQTVLADLQAQPSERRPFIRYVSLAHRRLAGASEAELTAERAALSLMLNSTSTREALAPPVAVDGEAELYRIDLRDYGWDRELEVAGVIHRDGWEAIIATNLYAVAFSGSEADELALLTNTVVPFVFAESVVQAISGGELYHALAGVPAVLDSEPPAWGFDRLTRWEAEDVVRAGNANAAHIASDESVLVERYAMPETGSPVWISTGDYAWGGDSIFGNPIQFGNGEAFVAFSLANRLLGYGIYGINSERIIASEALPEMTNAKSCFGCHVEGPLRIVDMVRGYIEASPEYFDVQTAAPVLAVYPPQAELDAIFASDQAAYRAQLTLLGIPAELGAEVITTTLGRFERPLSLTQAAAELGVEPERLSSSLDRLGPELAGLAAGGEVSRSDFTHVFAASLCSLHAGETGHRPVTVDCPRR